MHKQINYEDIVLKNIDKYLDLIYPLIGLGNHVKDLIDLIATKCYKDIFDEFSKIKPNVSVLSIEGERDGIDVSLLKQNSGIRQSSSIFLAIDPVDGTLTTSRGGCRGVSVIAIDDNINKMKFKYINDDLCCLSLGSNIDVVLCQYFGQLK